MFLGPPFNLLQTAWRLCCLQTTPTPTEDFLLGIPAFCRIPQSLTVSVFASHFHIWTFPFVKKYRDLTKVTEDLSLHSGSHSLSTKKSHHTLVSLIEHKLFCDLSAKQSLFFGLFSPFSGRLHWNSEGFFVWTQQNCYPPEDVKIKFSDWFL